MVEKKFLTNDPDVALIILLFNDNNVEYVKDLERKQAYISKHSKKTKTSKPTDDYKWCNKEFLSSKKIICVVKRYIFKSQRRFLLFKLFVFL